MGSEAEPNRSAWLFLIDLILTVRHAEVHMKTALHTNKRLTGRFVILHMAKHSSFVGFAIE